MWEWGKGLKRVDLRGQAAAWAGGVRGKAKHSSVACAMPGLVRWCCGKKGRVWRGALSEAWAEESATYDTCWPSPRTHCGSE
jgi:hypothetical protein